MKILLGAPEYPPYHIWGWGPVFEALANEYKKLWHEVMVVYGYYPTKTWFEKIKQYERDRIQYVQVPLLPTPKYLSFLKTVLPTYPRNLPKIKKIIKNFNPNLAHLHWYGLLFINQLAKVIQKQNIRYIYTLHGAPVSADKKWWIIQKVYNLYKKTWWKNILDHAKDITAVSQYTIDNFKEFHPYKDRIRVVNNGIYPEDFQRKINYNIYDKYNLPKDATIYLSIGRIEWIKGFDQFIKMIPKLVEEGVDVRYFIAWRDNWYKKTLDELAKKLGIEDRVYYLGFIAWDDKLSALQNANYMIISSHTESFGLTALEAMASWLIPIVNNAGGLVDIVQNWKNGLIIDFTDTTSMHHIIWKEVLKKNMMKTVYNYDRWNIVKKYLLYN